MINSNIGTSSKADCSCFKSEDWLILEYEYNFGFNRFFPYILQSVF